MDRETLAVIREEIDLALGAGDYGEALAKIRQVEAIVPNGAAFYSGLAYYKGWGVEKDLHRAIQYFLTAASLQDDLEKDGYYFAGLVYLNELDDKEAALECFGKAADSGHTDAIVMGALSLWLLALQSRNAACATLRIDDCTQLNAAATAYASQSIQIYIDYLKTVEKDMEIAQWVCFGRAAQMLYNMACRGDIVESMQLQNRMGSYVSASLENLAARRDEQLHAQLWEQVVVVCYCMDTYGHELIAESFRALCGLLDCELHKSAEAFYRVRWHMKRIGELRKTTDPAEVEEVTGYLTDLDEAYHKMNRRYGRMVDDWMRRGVLPDIAVAYTEGAAPAVESCENFMTALSTSGSQSSAPPQNEGGLFGFFKKWRN